MGRNSDQKSDVGPLDLDKMPNNSAITGVISQWLLHKDIGQEDEAHGMTVLGNDPIELVCCIDCLGHKANCDPQKQSQIVKTK